MPTVLTFAMLPGSLVSQIAFVTICLVIVMLFLCAVALSVPAASRFQTTSRISILVMAYVLGITAVVSSGILGRAFIPLGPIFLASTVGLGLILGLTPLGARMSAATPIAWLVGFQSFRLPLELILHDWFKSGTIPETMTWTGSNWDIVAGIAAIVASPFAARFLWLGWAFNLLGIILLINVARVAVLSSPIPFGWGVTPPLELILYLPYAYIVPICVAGAACGHVLLTRRLLMERHVHKTQ